MVRIRSGFAAIRETAPQALLTNHQPSTKHHQPTATGGSKAMADETRKLLKRFGVTVTDFEAEAERLMATAARLSEASSKEEAARLLKDAAELCRELNQRWLETTGHVFAAQERLLSACAAA